MTANESLVTLNGLKKYDQRKGTAVIEAQELPVSPLNKVKELLTTDDDINTLSSEYSKTIETE